ncbi:hypothetical protein [Methylobacterium marchantiae]|uniref:YHS domain-containing protein n=1 Tax=Methylobacterium marchantiae TaxID=600331 RepID=A0ABW3WZG1_9HYPH|nr:hypothetical protein AIGOOFII_0972 [Methylobacterium marchantiae]
MKYRMIGLTRRNLAGAVLASCLPAPGPSLAGQGLIALNGFDAVSYFLDPEGQPLPGRPAFEWVWRGRTWRFSRAGNLAAFRDAPSTYAPRLGGYDPIGVVEGRLVDTDTSVFAILPGPAGEGLYLFRNGDHRSTVLGSPAIVAAAEAKWPALRILTDDGAAP